MLKLFIRSESHQLVDGWLYFKLTMIIIIDKVGIGEGRQPTFLYFRGREIDLTHRLFMSVSLRWNSL